jgi:hypothetical protein
MNFLILEDKAILSMISHRILFIFFLNLGQNSSLVLEMCPSQKINMRQLKVYHQAPRKQSLGCLMKFKLKKLVKEVGRTDYGRLLDAYNSLPLNLQNPHIQHM